MSANLASSAVLYWILILFLIFSKSASDKLSISSTTILLAGSVCPWTSYFCVCSRTTSLKAPSWFKSAFSSGGENTAPSKSSATKYLVIKLPVKFGCLGTETVPVILVMAGLAIVALIPFVSVCDVIVKPYSFLTIPCAAPVFFISPFACTIRRSLTFPLSSVTPNSRFVSSPL